jgi:hypothetical protein
MRFRALGTTLLVLCQQKDALPTDSLYPLTRMLRDMEETGRHGFWLLGAASFLETVSRSTVTCAR